MESFSTSKNKMHQVLKLKTADQNVWWTSDLHWNHSPKWEVPLHKKRGFDSVEEMNRAIINSINDNVAQNDILFHAGDLTLNCEENQFNYFLDSLVCQNIYTLFGNHPNPGYKIYTREVIAKYGEDIHVFPFRYKNLIFIGDYKEIMVDNQLIILNHYPLLSWNAQSSRSSWMVCGHEHGEIKELLPDYPDKKILDVGWDVFQRPINFQELKRIMDKKQIFSAGHH